LLICLISSVFAYLFIVVFKFKIKCSLLLLVVITNKGEDYIANYYYTKKLHHNKFDYTKKLH
jgi:hypothetical protein